LRFASRHFQKQNDVTSRLILRPEFSDSVWTQTINMNIY